jgi:carbon monoxide dehydrogenase subunit G
MLLTILIAALLLLIAFLIVVAIQPSTFRVSRSAEIAAPPDAVFTEVNDLHRWEAWSPWAKIDPASRTTYAGAESGEGAIMSWAGSDKVGEGRMTITESQADQRIRIRLDFIKPFRATNTAEFTFEPTGNGTSVTWSISGERNFVFKAMGLLINCDKMMGGQFDKGLAQLKAVAEARLSVE